MARQVITVLTDDLDGGDADRTIEFGVQGQHDHADRGDEYPRFEEPS